MNGSSKYRETVKTRFDLLTLLSEACEIEHGLACSYLYSAFSLKQETAEGISPLQLQKIKRWGGQIFYIASQEMLHLAQVWNMLNAIGGTAYYFRPNFPQKNKYYSFNLPLALEPFSPEALSRFISYELPSNFSEKNFIEDTFGYVSEDNYSYKTVGELYGLIRKGFENITEKDLFIGEPSLQLTQKDIDFREIIPVYKKEDALKAIDMITHQGEGTSDNHDDCHHNIFVTIQNEFLAELEEDQKFVPARNIVTNPITFSKGNYQSEEGQFILNEKTRIVSDIFDDLYNLMLRSLQYSFSTSVKNDSDFLERRLISKFAIELMIRAIKPIGEVLTILPAYNNIAFKSAGPSFALSRHIPLPNNPNTTKTIIIDRTQDIIDRIIEINTELKLEKLNSSVFNLKDCLTQLSKN